MRLQIVGRHMTVTAALRRHVEQRVTRLERFLDGTEKVHVVFSVERFRQTAEGTVSTRRGAVTAKAATSDMYVSVDALMHKLVLQIQKKKERLECYKVPRVVEVRQRPRLDDEAESVEKVSVAVPTLTRDGAIASFRKDAKSILVFREAPSRKILILCRGEDGVTRLVEPTLDRFF
ncbi:MAG: ribosome hibernation-promoting factor, HPF/YfiA family [Nitrospira sp.]